MALSPAEPVPEAPAPSAAFRRYDLNSDGKLDMDEIVKMVESLGYRASPEYVEQLIETYGQFDHNDDGAIDPTEFDKLWKFLVRGRAPCIVAFIQPVSDRELLVHVRPCVSVFSRSRAVAGW